MKFYSRRPHYGNVLEETDKLPLFHLFSDIIPFNDNGTTGILSFDTPSVESFLYIKDFSRHFNKTISNIIFVNCNHANEHIYNQYKSEITDFSNINPLYLSLEMNCGRNLKASRVLNESKQRKNIQTSK